MGKFPKVGNLWVNLGLMLGSLVIEKIFDYVFEEKRSFK